MSRTAPLRTSLIDVEWTNRHIQLSTSYLLVIEALWVHIKLCTNHLSTIPIVVSRATHTYTQHMLKIHRIAKGKQEKELKWTVEAERQCFNVLYKQRHSNILSWYFLCRFYFLVPLPYFFWQLVLLALQKPYGHLVYKTHILKTFTTNPQLEKYAPVETIL